MHLAHRHQAAQQRLAQQKQQQQAINQRKQEMVKKAVSDKLKQKFTFVGPASLNEQHEGLLGIIGILVRRHPPHTHAHTLLTPGAVSRT